MKTIIALLTTTMLVAGATSAMAYDQQATDDAMGYASVQTAQGVGGTGRFGLNVSGLALALAGVGLIATRIGARGWGRLAQMEAPDETP